MYAAIDTTQRLKDVGGFLSESGVVSTTQRSPRLWDHNSWRGVNSSVPVLGPLVSLGR